MKKINDHDLMEIDKKINNPFERETLLMNIKHNIGNGTFIWHDFGNGIAHSKCDYILYNNYDINISSNIPGAVLIFNLSNNIKYLYKNKQEFILKKNSFLICLCSDEFYTQMHLNKDTKYKAMTIGLKEKLFLELALKLEKIDEMMKKVKDNNHYIIDGGYMDSYQLNILSNFEDAPINDNTLSNLQSESMALNLTHYTINKIVKKSFTYENISIEKITSLERAKEIIIKYYDTPLSIKEIAYKSAINECYLKKDFKIYYGMTVYEMLQKQRLKRAKELLNNNLSVKESCIKVGYKHTGNFSKLFYKQYGISPSLYRKQQK